MTDRRKIGNVTLTTLDEVRGRYEITYYSPARRNTARLSGLNIPAGFIPRKLRASFVTMATRANVRENYLQRYVGHAPESILTKHYTSTTLDDLKREVLQPVIAYLSKIDREGVHHAQS